jgi:5-methylcytosine-specific restriction endonuclease McrA
MSSRSASAPSLSTASHAPSPALDPPPAPAPILSALAPDAAEGLSPVRLSAKGLHRIAVHSFRTGNRGRLSLCEALRVLHETRLYFDLGFPTIAAYAGAFFQLRRSEAFEHVRVAKAMTRLTQLRDAFGQGQLSWSVLKAVSRVASVESQADWIRFARRNGVERTLAEARDARRSRRDAPRDASFGLPNLDQKLILRFTRSDMEKVRGWLERHCLLVAESTGSDDVSLEQAILYLCERDAVLASEGDGAGERGVAYRAQIAYQQCPDCKRSRVATRDGFLEVPEAEVARFEGSAERVSIDGPTPPALRRRVMAREGGRCGNPRCGNRADHCHHIVFRSEGGKTELANEVAVCATCHALVHAGLLRVSGVAGEGLTWAPISWSDSLKHQVASGQAVADRLPVLHLVRESATADSVRGDGGSQSATADCCGEPNHGVNREDLAHGLRRLGVPMARSRQLIDAAIASLPPAEATEAEVLRRAIRSI